MKSIVAAPRKRKPFAGDATHRLPTGMKEHYRVWFEFLTFTRHFCRACRATFVTVAERSADISPLPIPFTESERSSAPPEIDYLTVWGR